MRLLGFGISIAVLNVLQLHALSIKPFTVEAGVTVFYTLAILGSVAYFWRKK